MLRAWRASLCGAVGGGEISRDRLRPAAGFADFGDDGFGLVRARAVMHEHAGAGRGERESSRAAHAARGAGDESSLSGQIGHGVGPSVRRFSSPYPLSMDSQIRDWGHCEKFQRGKNK